MNSNNEPVYTEANLLQRISNMIIDNLIICVLYVLGSSFMVIIGYSFFEEQRLDTFVESSSSDVYFTILWFTVMILYYYILENINGQTIAKYITKTRAVSISGEKATSSQILGRTLCRFIPFEAFSFLFGEQHGWHDSIPKTRVIKYKPNNIEQQLKQLIHMKEKGLINEKEFLAQKKRILQSI